MRINPGKNPAAIRMPPGRAVNDPTMALPRFSRISTGSDRRESMDTEKTLLQQIRDKEQEFTHKIDAAKKEADAMVTAAKTEADELLCMADADGKKSAEQVYWSVRGKTALEIEALNKSADLERAALLAKGERNIPAAAEQIVRYVTME
jgi:vacuolar-type H+-ATPase subunit H